MKEYAIGFDVGGTKCAVILGHLVPDSPPVIMGKEKFATAEFRDPYRCLDEMCRLTECLLQTYAIPKEQICGIGISCGGPLDPLRGIVQSPPNLPGWDDIPAVEYVRKQTGLDAKLENDANACALAEWKFGAGRGTANMIFLTFGTGLGAGIIANNALIPGHNGMAGECGHIRLAEDGPVGYGKAGSFEGFCSGGGIARLGQMRAKAALDNGTPFAWCPDAEAVSGITARSIAEAADQGDRDALAIYEDCGTRLGEGLSILIDILNPERIVIGSIFARSENLIRPAMEKKIRREALSISADVCKVVPAELGESIGDMASLAIAADHFSPR